MKRTIIKRGDVFSVQVSNTKKKYFQYIINDLVQLNSDVIRAFKEEYDVNSQPDISEITNGEIDFYAHCVVKFGIKLSYWKKYGNSSNVGNFEDVAFRTSTDYGRKTGEEPILVSENWRVWRINDDSFTYIGKLRGEYKDAEIGIVVTPKDILQRLKYGKYDFFYPTYE